MFSDAVAVVADAGILTTKPLGPGPSKRCVEPRSPWKKIGFSRWENYQNKNWGEKTSIISGFLHFQSPFLWGGIWRVGPLILRSSTGTCATLGIPDFWNLPRRGNVSSLGVSQEKLRLIAGERLTKCGGSDTLHDYRP